MICDVSNHATARCANNFSALSLAYYQSSMSLTGFMLRTQMQDEISRRRGIISPLQTGMPVIRPYLEPTIVPRCLLGHSLFSDAGSAPTIVRLEAKTLWRHALTCILTHASCVTPVICAVKEQHVSQSPWMHRGFPRPYAPLAFAWQPITGTCLSVLLLDSNLFPTSTIQVVDNSIQSKASVVFCGGGCHSGAGSESRAQMSCAPASISRFPSNIPQT